VTGRTRQRASSSSTPTRSSSSSSGRKDYAAIAASKITTPRDIAAKAKAEGKPKPKRILIYSRNKKGKTTLCASAPNVIISDPEEGGVYLEKINPQLYPIEKWEDIDEFYNYLKLGKHPYEWAAIDGLTKMHNMALKFVMNQAQEASLSNKPVQVDKRFYGQANEMLKGMMWNFHSLKMNVIFTAQERMEAPYEGEEDEDYEESAASYVPDLPKGARSAINSIVDVIGRLYVVKAEVKVKRGGVVEEVIRPQRRLWIGTSNQYDTGARSDFKLPEFMKNPTIPSLVELLDNGKVSK
jgi:hypothetical protein